jgi:rRNA maturation RNase YbeY
VEKKAIYFFSEEVFFVFKNKKKIREWISHSISNEKHHTGQLNFIFCSDRYLHKLNLEYLQHDTLTDIITFDHSEAEYEISGDIYISIDRVKNNAAEFKTTIKNELHRVMIHGILHLIGYTDKTAQEKQIMKAKEDYYLSLLPNFIR